MARTTGPTTIASSTPRSALAARVGVVLVCGVVAIVAAQSVTNAQRLATNTYTSAQGLAHNRVARIFRDPDGFLWFCTTDGLSRFDGQRFTTFGLNEGLAFPEFTWFLATRDGTYWVATNGSGVCRFNTSPEDCRPVEKPRPLFTVYPVGASGATSRVNVLFEDRAGRLWAGTDGGLFVLDRPDGSNTFVPVALGIPGRSEAVVQVWSFAEDGEGSLWIGTKYGLVRRQPDGASIWYAIHPSERDVVFALLLDPDGRMWLGHADGLAVFKPAAVSASERGGTLPWRRTQASAPVESGVRLPDEPGEGAWFTSADGLGSDEVTAIARFSNGHIYMVTNGGGLTEFDGSRFRVYSQAQGVAPFLSPTVTEDLDGNIWLGFPFDGVLKIFRNGFVSYTEADGLGASPLAQVFRDRSGDLFCYGPGWRLYRFDGSRFESIRLNLPASLSDLAWRGNNRVLHDHTGEWWVTSNAGLFRFPVVADYRRLATIHPKAVYTTRDGLAGNDLSELFEDSRGDIWISSFAPDREVVTRWDRATGRFERYTDEDGLRRLNAATAFCEDSAGNVWIGFREGGLARYRDGRFVLFGGADGIAEGTVSSLAVDREGRLWIASRRGSLLLAEHPDEPRPRFRKFTVADGLASERVLSTVEDELGRIYVGTLRGVDRLDPRTGEVRNFTPADGLSMGGVFASALDGEDQIWLLAQSGVSRYRPEPDATAPPPRMFISALTVAGTPYSVSSLGQASVSGLVLGPGQNQLKIEYFGLSFATGGALRYQYRLEGANDDWSAPTDQRSVDATLGPGAYTFAVRAVTPDGVVSLAPATVSFEILRPVWQRWWFLSLAALFAGLGVYALARYRVARLVELERVRTRIATDLHDDIGSSLSQMSVLSEIVQRRVGADSGVEEPLSTIANLARDLAEAMNDIVWAINPARDHMSDLSHRMRRFASDVFTARDLAFEFRTPDEQRDLPMGADLRRELFLVFKESVNNAVRHSGCTSADLELSVDEGWIQFRIADDGAGFDVDAARDGNGLTSMRRRAERLGGTFEVVSKQPGGTAVTVRLPIGRHPWWRAWRDWRRRSR